MSLEDGLVCKKSYSMSVFLLSFYIKLKCKALSFY